MVPYTGERDNRYICDVKGFVVPEKNGLDSLGNNTTLTPQRTPKQTN
jgi:hypothetical protein